VLHLVEPARAPVEMSQAVIEQHAVATEAADADQAIVAELAPGHFRLLGQGVVAPAGEHEGLVDQRGEVDFRALSALHVDAEIRFAANHCFQPLVSAEVEDTDADLRVLQVEGTDHRRQKVEGCGRDAGEGDLAGLSFGQFADAEDRTLEIVQQALCLWQKIPAHGRQADAARGAVQQLDTEAFFQLLHAPCQCRLRKMDGVGGLVEVAELGDFHESADVLQFVIHALELSVVRIFV